MVKKKGKKTMKAEGGKPMSHLGKMPRASGGCVGSDKSPLSSANRKSKD